MEEVDKGCPMIRMGVSGPVGVNGRGTDDDDDDANNRRAKGRARR